MDYVNFKELLYAILRFTKQQNLLSSKISSYTVSPSKICMSVVNFLSVFSQSVERSGCKKCKADISYSQKSFIVIL